MRAGSGSVWPYGGFLDYSRSFSLWHGYGSNQVEALAQAGIILDKPAWVAMATQGAQGLLVHVSVANGLEIEGLEPGPVDQTQIAYGATSMFQDYLALATVTHSQRFSALAGLTLGWYFGANRGRYQMYNPQTGIAFDGINSNGTLNRNSGAESTIEALMALEDAARHPTLSRFVPSGPPIANRVPLTVPASDGLVSNGQVVTPASNWTGQGAFTNGSYVVLKPGGQDTLYANVSLPGMDKIQVEASPTSTTEAVQVTIAGNTSTVTFQGISGMTVSNPVYLSLKSAPGTVPVYQGLSRIHLSLPSTAPGPIAIDSVVLQPALESASWPTAGKVTTVLKNMSGHTVSWTGANIEKAKESIPPYGFAVVTTKYTK